MPDLNDPHVLNTNVNWNGNGPILDQIGGKTFGIRGFAEGDFVAESVTATAHDTNGDNLISDENSSSPMESYTVNAGEAVTSATGDLQWIGSLNGFEIRLVDGTVLTHDDLGGRDTDLLINIMGSNGGRRVWFDFNDRILTQLNKLPQIASIYIPTQATTDFSYAQIQFSSYNDEYAPVCFGSGTLIKTQDSMRPVETLRVGDMILTVDNGLQPIRWIGSRHLSAEELLRSPKFKPIRIKAGRLGANTPATDLIVSPQHRVLIRSKVAYRMFNADEVLIAAKHLLEADGIEVAEDMSEVEYFHILFDQHEVIFSNGAETESLYTGIEAIKSLSPAARDEIFSLFPELQDLAIIRPAARLLISGRMGRELAMRHVKNKHQFVY